MSDPEKLSSSALGSPAESDVSGTPAGASTLSLLQRIAKWEDSVGVESRGIEQVPASQRMEISTSSIIQIALTWCSINMVANNMLVGMLGPHVFGLSFKDSAVIAVLGNLLGCAGPAYIAGYGPGTGNRTLVVLRFVFGWYPAKLCAVLQLIGTLGYGLLDALVTGQILSAVSPHGSMTVVVGVIVAAVIVIIVCGVGMKVFHVYERYQLIPQLMVLCILIGVAGSGFDMSVPSIGDAATVRGNRISFFFAIFNTTFIWSMCAADYFVYYPVSTPRWLIGSLTHVGIFVGIIISEIIGIGLASGAVKEGAWKDALDQGAGTLMVEAFKPLGGFGKFCAVVLALGPIANTIPGVYSSALAFQILHQKAILIPRFFWTIFGILLYTVCAIAGRNKLFPIFENFLALMGYWVAYWVVIQVEDEVLFGWWRRRVECSGCSGEAQQGDDSEVHNMAGYTWTSWNQKTKLPLGLAAITAFLIAWMGGILSMYQLWWVGPLGKAAYGDIGVPVGVAFAAVVYPPLRWCEVRIFRR
ncbi:Similar to Purine-cytosine permease fcyB; acc. no. C8V329 [Pyronema omphalodes CBS 100304]|uniref:Similar to Purine-cytosine permease fcyB acc. no. C8V329 n=1 Tax=Pyronema omphalodes (strain CBS 100304) TaxID=1076935 RepID=U4LUP8_PYROM|nr:Similar to Purine-cytosine permease fcyB; acc. no. C8V329 [Pyronema omphalodes CBS 100304]